MAWSYNAREFEDRMEPINAYDTGVYDDVMKSKPKSWCRAFYKLGFFFLKMLTTTSQNLTTRPSTKLEKNRL